MKITTFKIDQICIEKMHFQPKLLQNTLITLKETEGAARRLAAAASMASGYRQALQRLSPAPSVI